MPNRRPTSRPRAARCGLLAAGGALAVLLAGSPALWAGTAPPPDPDAAAAPPPSPSPAQSMPEPTVENPVPVTASAPTGGDAPPGTEGTPGAAPPPVPAPAASDPAQPSPLASPALQASVAAGPIEPPGTAPPAGGPPPARPSYGDVPEGRPPRARASRRPASPPAPPRRPGRLAPPRRPAVPAPRSAGPAIRPTRPPAASAPAPNPGDAAPGVSPDTSPVPAAYLRLYRRFADRAGLDWAVLAAVGSIESDHGRSTLPGVRDGRNAAGCCAGPMQFNLTDGPPSTWGIFGTDGDGDGRVSPYSPADAIASAARKLVADGAPGDYPGALLKYNDDPAYLEAVLRRAAWYRAYGHGGPYAWPLGDAEVRVIGVPGVGTHTLGNWQSDNAVDLSAPVGTTVYATCDGVIGPGLGAGRGGLDPASRFGGLRMTLSCADNRFWYGHLSAYAPGVLAGAHVRRGQTIGRSGTANGVQHLHLAAEFGDPRILLGLTPGAAGRSSVVHLGAGGSSDER